MYEWPIFVISSGRLCENSSRRRFVISNASERSCILSCVRRKISRLWLEMTYSDTELKDELSASS